VADCGFSLEQDEELSYDTATPRRNGATLVTLEQADVVLAVGSADPVGLQRLVRGLAELSELRPGLEPVVVVNRLRSSAVGGSPESRVREALARYAGVEDVVVVPDDRPALDAALLAGRSLTETASGSPARRAVVDLATRLMAGVAPVGSPSEISATQRHRRRRSRR
jgi:Flp pilus assembly CpaE family ATPase